MLFFFGGVYVKSNKVSFDDLLKELSDNVYYGKSPSTKRIKCGTEVIELQSTYEEQSHEYFVLYYLLSLNGKRIYKTEDSSQIILFLQSYLANREFEITDASEKQNGQSEEDNNVENQEHENSKKVYAERKKAELTAAYRLLDETCEKIFTRSENPTDIVSLLDIYSKFMNLGITNAVLIFAQKPNAKEIHDIKYWNEHGYQFKKGQHAFLLIEKGKEYKKKDGTKGYWRNTAKYFDVSQTTATYRESNKTTYSSHALIKALLLSSPVNYESYIPEKEEIPWPDFIIAKYFPDQRKIAIRTNLPSDKYFIHFSTALAMAFLDRGGDFKDNLSLYQFDAKCIAYLLSKRYNIDCSMFDFDNIPSEYMNYDTTRLKHKLYEIAEVERTIHEKIYRNLQRVLKEYQKSIDDDSKMIGVYQQGNIRS